MYVDHLPFGQFVNTSEERAFEQLYRRLKAENGDTRFVIITNLVYSVSGGGQPDEIDMVIVGVTGVHVVEVKHWDRGYIRSHQYDLEAEADKIARKARKVATNLRRRYPRLGFVAPKMLLTKEQRTLQREGDEPFRGVRLFALTDWRNLIELDDLTRLPEAQIDELCEEIAPRSRAVLSGDLRRLGGITDLALLSSAEDRFHRVYRGRNTVNQDQVIMRPFGVGARGTRESGAPRVPSYPAVAKIVLASEVDRFLSVGSQLSGRAVLLQFSA